MTNQELDRLAAEKAMGWHMGALVGEPAWLDQSNTIIYFCADWHPSTNREQAMMLLDKMGAEQYALCKNPPEFRSGYSFDFWRRCDGRGYKGDGDSEALAITEACLRSVGEKVE